MEVNQNMATLAIMHIANGLEFKSVVVMACDSGVIPSSKHIENMGDDADLEDIYIAER